jgi:BirA family transcriptional regulator, biotin operon repressor / biotin---[acetyl-CoA-carboxylase] ligase
MSSEATRVRYIVLGIGLNVNHRSFPPDLQEIATSLRMVSGTEWSRVDLATGLLKSLDREYRGVLKGGAGRESILRRFSERSTFVRGKQIRIDENSDLDGVTEGLDANGFLQVRTAQGPRTVLSGTVWPR